MADSEFVEEFFRIERETQETRILVRMISWDGPYTPVSKWVPGLTLSDDASATDVDEAISTLLQDPKFFCLCEECSERKPVGWMHDERICQGCASRNHGVVY